MHNTDTCQLNNFKWCYSWDWLHLESEKNIIWFIENLYNKKIFEIIFLEKNLLFFVSCWDNYWMRIFLLFFQYLNPMLSVCIKLPISDLCTLHIHIIRYHRSRSHTRSMSLTMTEPSHHYAHCMTSISIVHQNQGHHTHQDFQQPGIKQ